MAVAGLAVILTLGLIGGAVAAAPPSDNPGKGPPELEKIVFIHYADDSAPGRPDNPGGGRGGGGGGGSKDDPLLYELSKLILPGTATYAIDPSSANTSLSPTNIRAAIEAGFESWDAETDAELFGDTVGTVSVGGAGAQLDTINTLSWGLLDDGILAMATMWYYPGKPPREIVEFDVVFNTRYLWGIDGGSGLPANVYDIQNIATHEAGHPVGLNDLYDKTLYGELTMYGYSSADETKKRSLEQGDIDGAQQLYGAP